MDDPELSRASAAYVARLDRTLKGLQTRVKEQEAALEKARLHLMRHRSYVNERDSFELLQLRLS